MRYERTRFLINKKFQFRFAWYIFSWLLALSSAYPLIIIALFDYFLKYLALDPNGPAVYQIEQTKKNVFIFLMIMQLILLSITFLISLFMSHRIAGPLYKLQNFFREAHKTHFKEKISFRKSDYFLELADGYNEMIKNIQLQHEIQQQKLTLTQNQLEKILYQHSGLPSPIQKELQSSLDLLKR